LQKDVEINPIEKELENIECELLNEKQVQQLESQTNEFKVSKNESGEPLY